MTLLHRVASILRWMVRRNRAEHELDDELRAFVDMAAADKMRDGASPDEARRSAVLLLGGVEQAKERIRSSRRGAWLDEAARDGRYALRALRRAPGFLGASIATLGVGSGGAIALFTVVNGSLLRPLPGVADPGTLVTVERRLATTTDTDISYPDYRDLANTSSTLAGLAAYNGTSLELNDASGSTRAWVSYTTANFFDVLGVRPAVGRLYGGAEWAEADGDLQVVVLSNRIWQQRFGGSEAIVGSTVRLDGHAFRVIGVAPEGFVGAMAQHHMELFIPATAGGRLSQVLEQGGIDATSRRQAWLRLVGRLAPGSGVEAAQVELEARTTQLVESQEMGREWSVQVLPGAGLMSWEREQLSRVPGLLAIAVGLLLLIACANVAVLMLLRLEARRRELATRLALGAPRAALMRQVAFEGALVAASAGALGVFIARLMVRSDRLVRSVVPLDAPDLTLDVRVIMVALAASAVTAVMVSMAPAWRIRHASPGFVIKDGSGVGRRQASQRVLVAAQVAASLVLLSAAAVVLGSTQRVLRSHDVFDPAGLVDARLEFDPAVRRTRQQAVLYRTVLTQASSHPAVDGVAVSSTIPPFAWAQRVTVFRRGAVSASALREPEGGQPARTVAVSEGFFDLMRIPVLSGRPFLRSDTWGSEAVALLSKGLADALWPQGQAVGEHVVWPGGGVDGSLIRVVGVAADLQDVKLSGIPPPALYLPFEQWPQLNVNLIARARAEAVLSESTIRTIVGGAAPEVGVLGVRTLADRLTAEVRPERTASVWIGAFGVIALLVTSIGLYGVVAQSVLQRTRELAVRMAVGATSGRVLRTVLDDGFRVMLVGMLVGGLGAIGLWRVVQAVFPVVRAVDLITALPMLMVFGAVAFAATAIPAWRASRLNPADVLRAD